MDNTNASNASNSGSNLFSNNNFLIIVLISLLILSFLGINLITIAGNFLQNVVVLFTPLVTQLFAIFGYTTGSVLNKTTDLVSDTAKTGIDIAGGTLHDIGNLLENSGNSVKFGALQIDHSINTPPQKKEEPKPDKTSSPIQKPISAAKTNWCLVGEYQGRRGCVEIGEHDKCLSGQIFPSQKMCLNPTLSNNMDNKKK